MSAATDQTSDEPARWGAACWALGAIAALGLGLRLWSLGYGLPAVYNMDETPILDRALTFAKGDPNPHNFLYPTLYLYALFAWEGLYFVMGRGAGWFSSLDAFQSAYFSDPSGHFLAARALGVLFGTLTIGAVYLFGSRLFGRPVGIGAALLLAIAPMAVRDAHYVKLDVTVTLFATLACAALAVIVVDPARAARRRTWLVAGGIAGLAISTHYYAAFVWVAFLVTAAIPAGRTGGWRTSVGLLAWAGLATLIAFAATSPFFFVEPRTVIRDFTELREVDIDRAVTVGPFSSLPAYAWLLMKAVGYPVFLLGTGGALLAIARDWRRGLLLISFPLAFLLFVSNTFPASRYLNILLPSVCVAAAYAAWHLATRAGAAARSAMAASCLILAAPGAIDSVGWDRFFARDDTRTEARAFIERTIPAGTTIAVQPYSAPIRQSRGGLIEALRAHLGDEARAPRKFQLQLAVTPYPALSYRVLYIGESGKTKAPPGDLDKIYIPPAALSNDRGLEALRAAGVSFVVLTRYGPTSPALAPLEAALRREGSQVAEFSPYAVGGDPSRATVPPFRHNSNMWLDPQLERPGPIVVIWRVG